MKILAFDIDEELLGRNQASLSDTIRMALYQADSALFEKLNYDDDTTFLEPTLFCYFLSNVSSEDKIPLEQCLLGYLDRENWPQNISVKADQFGLANLPNLGYLRTEPYEQLQIETPVIEDSLTANEFIPNCPIRLCLHPTDLLAYENGVTFDEPVAQSLAHNKVALLAATGFFQTHLSEFWQAIESTVREFVVFSSPNYNSFAGIMQHGTAYFNVQNKRQTLVFFIDDIAHQCGHVIFNALTLETEKYLIVPKDHPMQGHTEMQGETRGAYGAFHGLFTYTTILHSLDKVLDSEAVLDAELRHEAIGRMGFYFEKFGHDLQLIHKAAILTEAGLNYLQQFAEGFQYITQKYGTALSHLNYDNQPYIFQYDFFKALNPIQKSVSV